MSAKVVRRVDFLPKFREDLAWWIKNDLQAALRTLDLVESVLADPFSGIGSPSPCDMISREAGAGESRASTGWCIA